MNQLMVMASIFQSRCTQRAPDLMDFMVNLGWIQCKHMSMKIKFILLHGMVGGYEMKLLIQND